MERDEKKKHFIINVVYYAIIAVAVIVACKYILPVLTPFIAAFLIAALIQIPANKIGRGNKVRKKTTSVVCCILIYALIFGMVILLGIMVMEGAGNILTAAPEFYNETVVPLLGEISDRLETVTASVDISISQKIEEFFSELSQNMGESVTKLSVNLVKLLSESAAKIPGFIVKLVITIVATFFMAVDFDHILNFLKKWIPAGKENRIENMVGYTKNVVGIYLKSYTLLFFLTFTELFFGFLILKIPYAGMLALAIAIFDILPVLGTGGILLPWSVLLVFMGNIPLAVGILVLYVVITVVRNIVEPKIVGKQMGIHPLAALIFMFVGLRLFGIIGMILFPVALSVAINLKKDGFFCRSEEEN